MFEIDTRPARLPSDPEQLLAILRDKAEIEFLVRRYADICDEDYDPAKLVHLYTEDATWSSSSEGGTSEFGTHVGRDAIMEFFGGVSGQVVFAHHIVMSPEIEILEPGKRARGRWNTLVFMNLFEDEYGRESERKLIAAVYHHEYRCGDDGWRISRLHVHIRFDARIRGVD
jgi:hypothetical protein